jgi:2-polyprenyl-6-methoxyphenol hydroxylase-like FAD-dependent oxidoreductase
VADPRVVVIGAGPAGLATALALARRGRPVTVLDRDAAQPIDNPASAYERWHRPSVPQSPQPHSLLGRTRRALRLHAPDVLASLFEAGAWENDFGHRLVGAAAGPAADDDLVAVHCRRPVFECVLRAAVLHEPLATLVSGATVDGIDLAAGDGSPRVTGVRVGGIAVDADVVVDASGRRSHVPLWVGRSGVSLAPEEVEECGVVYFSRYFKLREGLDYPSWRGVLGPSGTTDCCRFSIFFGDSGTFAIVLGVPAWERELKSLKLNDLHMEAVRRFRSLAPFVANDVAQPITDVLPFGALQNVFRPPLLEGAVPVRGLHFVGDAYCHTNPLFAWGLCLGVDHGFELGRIIDEHASDVETQSLAFAALTRVEAEQCYHAVADEDRDRSLTWRGSQPRGPFLGRSFAGFVRQCALPTVMLDPQVAQAVLRRSNLLDPPEALARDEQVLQRVIDLQSSIPPQPPGDVPDREELLELIRVRASIGS